MLSEAHICSILQEINLKVNAHYILIKFSNISHTILQFL